MAADDALREAWALLRHGELAGAEAACRAVLARRPRDAAALHLLGLVRKEAGAPAEGERLLRASLDLAPGRAEFHANLAHLLRRLGRLAEAEASYRRSLDLDPHHRPARLGLARTLAGLGRHADAERECRALLAESPGDPQAWSALALTLRSQRRLEAAESAYRRAIELAPDLAAAHHNLGELLLEEERAEEALAALERAAALGARRSAVAFNLGRALVQLYRFDEAERCYAEAVALDPRSLDAQLNLARLRFMRGDPRFARDLARAAAGNRADLRLQMLFADVLRRAGDLRASEILLRDLMARHGAAPELRSSLASVLQEAGRLEDAEREARAAVRLRPEDPKAAQNLVSVLLGLGRADEALMLVRAERRRAPLDQGWIAYEATAARLCGDPAHGRLCDYAALVRVYDLEPPAGWGSIEELNSALAAALAARHRFASHPLDQSLRNGSQTARDLRAETDPAIRAVLAAFAAPIEDYRASLRVDAAHPLRARGGGRPKLAGCWSVQLRRNGFHVNHIHPEGWLSSAYYVSVPPESQDEERRSGWLKFGEPRLPVPGATPERMIPPRPGRLVLFPSYMWHGTTPIAGEEPRLTIAFDVVTAP